MIENKGATFHFPEHGFFMFLKKVNHEELQ